MVTSKERLHEPATGGSAQHQLPPQTKLVPLKEFDTATSRALLKQMRVLAQKVTPADGRRLREEELRAACAAWTASRGGSGGGGGGGGEDLYKPPPDEGEETTRAASERHRGMAEALASAGAVAAGAADASEKEKDARERLRNAEAARIMRDALNSEVLRELLEQTLGNLPLSVALAGRLLRELEGACVRAYVCACVRACVPACPRACARR